MRTNLALDTSKFDSGAETYGRKGAFLASLAAMALLTVTSRHASFPSTNSVVIHHSNVIARLCPVPVQHELSFEHGSRITVTDLFGNMPVRVMHRAVSLQRTEDLDKEWDDLRKVVTGLLLAFKERIKVTVFDAQGSRKFLIRSHNGYRVPTNPEDVQARVLNRSLTILSQSGYITPRDFNSWVMASARTSDIVVQSAISLRPCPTKKVQFVSLGILPLDFTYASFLYSSINRLFALSSFGIDEHAVGSPVNIDHKTARTSSKGVNKWPMFVVWIELKHQVTDVNNDPLGSRNTLQHILDVVTAMFRQFLEQNHFSRPKAKSKGKKAPVMSPSSGSLPLTRPRSCIPKLAGSVPAAPQALPPDRPTEMALASKIKFPVLPIERNPDREPQRRDFGSWSRVKSAKSGLLDEIRSGYSSGGQAPVIQPRHTSGGREAAELKPFRPLSEPSFRHTNQAQHPDSFQRAQPPDSASDRDEGGAGDGLTDDTIRWVDPISKNVVLINKRTGQTIAGNKSTPRSSHFDNSASLPHFPRRFLREEEPEKPRRSSTWLDAIFKEWENPVFPLTERPLQSATLGCSNGQLQYRGHSNHDHAPFSGLCETEISSPAARYSFKLTKDGLRNAHVISQVDNKFLLIKMGTGTRDDGLAEILVLVDQHAADERHKVEMLFEELCGSSRIDAVEAVTLAEPISFKVSTQEARMFRSRSEYFASWGCFYIVAKDSMGGNDIRLTKLPVLIAERCRLEPKIAIDMLRTELWAQHDNEMKSSMSHGHSERSTETWVKRIGNCPKGIINLLNSRACRTAIMFNDVLTYEDCTDLISRLATCAFPFQCAHGRPTMVPIVNVPSLDNSAVVSARHEGNASLNDAFSTGLDRPANFVQAFKAWETQRADDGSHF